MHISHHSTRFGSAHGGTEDHDSTRRGASSIALAVALLPFLVGIIRPSGMILGSLAEAISFSSSSADERVVVPERDYVSFEVWVTAYSSSVDETSDHPFLTASGELVRDGIVASNFLPFGTEIMIPEFFGNRVFVVKDRMHKRKKDFVDIWMISKEAAVNFGIHRTDIYVLSDSD